MSHDDLTFGVLEDALNRTSELPKAAKRDNFICPLGMEEYPWWVYNLLCVSGITVELLQVHEDEEGDLFCAVQIVDAVDLKMRMSSTTTP